MECVDRTTERCLLLDDLRNLPAQSEAQSWASKLTGPTPRVPKKGSMPCFRHIDVVFQSLPEICPQIS